MIKDAHMPLVLIQNKNYKGHKQILSGMQIKKRVE